MILYQLPAQPPVAPMCYTQIAGQSDVAEDIFRQTQQLCMTLKSCDIFDMNSDIFLAELHQTYKECQEENWDGYDARPISLDSYDFSRALVDSMPLGIPSPCPSAIPEGLITLEWYRHPLCLLTVCVNIDGVLDYSALLGKEKIFGSVPFHGEVPEQIISLIKRIIHS